MVEINLGWTDSEIIKFSDENTEVSSDRERKHTEQLSQSPIKI